MTDPKGTYYSPQESGFATVLRPGPNFLGIAQQQQALAARKDQLAMQRQAKLDNEREKQVSKIVADLSKPVPTAFPYQNPPIFFFWVGCGCCGWVGALGNSCL